MSQLFMLSLYCLSVGPQGGELDDNMFPMAADGHATATIVIAKEPTPSSQLAALELQYHICVVFNLMS